MGKNGRKGIVVLGTDTTSNTKIKLLPSGSSAATPNQAWTLKYDATGILHLPSYEKFKIVSELSTDIQNWCLFPKNNKLKPKTIMPLQKCQPWKAWKMDTAGRIVFHN